MYTKSTHIEYMYAENQSINLSAFLPIIHTYDIVLYFWNISLLIVAKRRKVFQKFPSLKSFFCIFEPTVFFWDYLDFEKYSDAKKQL